MITVQTITLPAPAWNKNEILRYAGVKGSAPEVEALLETCMEEARNVLSYKICWCDFPVTHACHGMDLGFVKTESVSLQRLLRDCGQIVLFAATVGLELDRLIAKYSRVEPAKAVLLQAIGTERVESLCDAFEELVQTLYGPTTPRFSPGYGDFPLEMQRDIFGTLSCQKHIGLTLNESLIMSPSKSVTAILGIGSTNETAPEHNCAACGHAGCAFRREV